MPSPTPSATWRPPIACLRPWQHCSVSATEPNNGRCLTLTLTPLLQAHILIREGPPWVDTPQVSEGIEPPIEGNDARWMATGTLGDSIGRCNRVHARDAGLIIGRRKHRRLVPTRLPSPGTPACSTGAAPASCLITSRQSLSLAPQPSLRLRDLDRQRYPASGHGRPTN